MNHRDVDVRRNVGSQVMELKQEDERRSDHVFTSVSGEHISLRKFMISNYRKLLTKSILLLLPSRLERWVSCLKYLNFLADFRAVSTPDGGTGTSSLLAEYWNCAMWVPVPSLLQAVYGESCDWWCVWTISRLHIQGGSNMTGTDLCVNKPYCAAAVRTWESEATTSTLPSARVRTCSVLSGSC